MPPIEKPSTSIWFKPSARLQTKCAAEGDRVRAHLLERGRDLAGAAGDPCVVEQDHLTIVGQAIRHRRVPVIHGAQVVHFEDERHASILAEAAIGEADSVGLDDCVGAV
jgi:hypothetical protein